MGGKLKQVTVRVSERHLAVLKHEAKLEGVSLNQYLQDAALAFAYMARGRRGEDLHMPPPVDSADLDE